VSERYVALAIQGRLAPARELLGEVEAGGTPAEQDLAGLFSARFVERSEPLTPASGSPLIDDLVGVYRAYWRDALMDESTPQDHDRGLERALTELLQAHGRPLEDAADTDAIHGVLQEAVQAEGFTALPGRAPPLQDLLLWGSQAESRFEVELTDQRREVAVVFLSGFVSRGWKHYASLGLVTTSGWTENGMLYCVDQAYEPGTEAFDVSYLRHESRHLADRELFPGLPAADLEYRAKLTELAFASDTLRSLLEEFTTRGAQTDGAPHAEANHRVTQDLYRELYGRPFTGNVDAWMTLNTNRVNRAARRLLQRDSNSRLAKH